MGFDRVPEPRKGYHGRQSRDPQCRRFPPGQGPVLAARFSGRVRQRSLKRLAGRDADARAKEILFLKDRVYQLEMQVSILQKHLNRKGRSPRYTARERLLILWHIEAFQIPTRKVSQYFGIARSPSIAGCTRSKRENPPAHRRTRPQRTLPISSGRSTRPTSVGAASALPTN